MAVSTSLFPAREPITDKRTGLISERWNVWFRDLTAQVNSNAASVVPATVLLAQNANISTTPVLTPTLSAGLYRTTAYARVTSPAATSSDLKVTFHWTDGSASCFKDSDTINGNTTATTLSFTYTMHIDGGSPISYSTTYNSNPPAAMLYSLYVVVESIGQ